MADFEIDVTFILTGHDGDDESAYRYVDSFLDKNVTPILPEGLDWEMVEECVTPVGNE